ncbi:MAG: Glu/Leu/Phe/Val dehydrogenase [Tissierellia bacterium]|jgi:leucine dehydrogenase|nr:Glu/Leu/Phe/Val dehydrogenase [Tissierellia bacterium]HOA20412.1 Glu/Leu/Phe/Val dehydrogenase [Sedimentibacter sp.]HPY56342.1 Glu/Leu/Phe/Val dehydrogenase [Sedimentibacter sp.]
MDLFSKMEEYDYEQLILCQDKSTGLKAIIAIHDTTLGPALGGTRICEYESDEEAIEDALRLARGMTYKNAAAGLNLGGGKAVIIGDPRKIKSEALFRAFGRFVEGLNGRYITGEDMNATQEDASYINCETEYIVGLETGSGNPSPVTAYGVFKGIQAALNEVYGSDDLTGKTVAIQGLGAVGRRLAERLHEAGAKLYVTTRDKAKIDKAVAELGATAVSLDEIYGVECDVFSPCARGAIINDKTIEQFKCKIIAGAANNQLAESRHGDMLHEKGILYVPDYIINSGGVINIIDDISGREYNRENAMKNTARIYDSCKKVFEIAKRDNIPTYKAADIMAEERIAAVGRIKKIYNR